MKNLAVSSIIESDAVIGEGSSFGYFCHIRAGVRIGKNVHFGNNVNVYPGTIIEDNCVIGDGATFGGHEARSQLTQHLQRGKPTVVERECVIGANVTIVGSSVVKRGSTVGDGSVVLGLVPPFSFVAGNPARKIYSVSSVQHEKN